MNEKKIVAITAMYSRATMIHPDPDKSLTSAGGALMTPLVTLRMVTQTNRGIMAAHTTMQNGHST